MITSFYQKKNLGVWEMKQHAHNQGVAGKFYLRKKIEILDPCIRPFWNELVILALSNWLKPSYQETKKKLMTTTILRSLHNEKSPDNMN